MPSPTTLDSRRTVNPVLTNLAEGYSNDNDAFVGHLLFPEVPVPARSTEIIVFGKDGLQDTFKERKPGEDYYRSKHGWATKANNINQFAEEAQVTDEELEEARNAAAIDLAKEEVMILMDKAALSMEVRQAKQATTMNNYAAANKVSVASGDKWTSDSVDPIKVIRAKAQAVRKATGRRPNVFVCSEPVFEAIVNNPNVIDRFKHTTAQDITADMIAKLLRVSKVGVGGGVKNTASGNADIWGNDAVLAYVNLNAKNASRKVNSYGYTYALAGNSIKVEQYREDRNRSTMYPVTVEKQPVVSNSDAGFLFKNAI